MKVIKNSIVFLLVLMLIILIPISCHANSKKRSLSTPLSRLVGHWQDKHGFNHYFSPLDRSTTIGSFIYVYPNKEKLMKFFWAEREAKALEMLKRGKFKSEKEAKEWLESEMKGYEKGAEGYAGMATYFQYKVRFQLPEGKKVKIVILYDESDPLSLVSKENIFNIEKDGKQMLYDDPFGEVINPIKYIDSKTSPEDK